MVNSYSQEDKSSDRELFPALFVGVGSPLNAIEENQYSISWKNIGQTIPKPKAILVISGRWCLRRIKVTAGDDPETIHDFGGFPYRLQTIEYNAKGSKWLVNRVKDLIGEQVSEEYEWGLDHGAWTVLLNMYPKADVPVVQLSVDLTKSTQQHYEVAQKLQQLRKENVLILGSGQISSNQQKLDFTLQDENQGLPWAVAFSNYVVKCVQENDVDGLINYKKQGKESALAVPKESLFVPLLYVIGVRSEKDNVSFPTEGYINGNISMQSVLLQ